VRRLIAHPTRSIRLASAVRRLVVYSLDFA
jgi:hypothetical protein